MLETIEVGLRDSQLLNAAGLDAGMLSDGTDVKYGGIETALECCGSGELVEDSTLLVMRRSSTLLRFGVDETWSNDLSVGPPSAATMSESDTPRSKSSERSFLFSSRTFLAALCISADASIPTWSQLRNLASSSCRYSFRRARERPICGLSATRPSKPSHSIVQQAHHWWRVSANVGWPGRTATIGHF